MNGLQILSLVDVMEGNIVDDQGVKMKFFILINSVLDSVDGACCGLLLTVEGAQGPLHL